MPSVVLNAPEIRNITYCKPLRADPDQIKEVNDAINKSAAAYYAASAGKGAEKLDTDQEIIPSLLGKCTQKLLDLGITENDILPTKEDIIIVRSKTNFGGAHALSGMVLYVPFEVDINDPRVHTIFFHEFAHYITEKVVSSPKKDNLTDLQRGFRLRAIGFNQKYGAKQTGIYEESLADLFAAYCMSDEPIESIGTAYPIQLGFMILLIRSIQGKMEGEASFQEAFAYVFKAKVHRDFSYQGFIANKFGNKTAGELNSIPVTTTCIPLWGYKKMIEVATSLGFIEDFLTFLNKVGAEGIQLEELNGVKIHAEPNSEETQIMKSFLEEESIQIDT